MKRSSTLVKRKMELGGWAKANQWANKNQEGISAGADFASATVDAFAPTDNYGVRSNGAALGSGALSGAAKGAALGSAIPIIGTAAGAVLGAGVGAVTGLLGNKSAQAKKTLAVNASTKAQLSSMEQGAEARIAGDPSLKYGNMTASYYANGGALTPQRKTPIIPKVQAKPRLMPNVGTAPARQMSKYAQGGEIEPLSTEDVKINGASHANGGVKIPAIGVELEGGETVNNGFVFSKKLGFAKPAEKIAKALGKAQARPENAINTATVNALQRKTELLKVHQEVAKEASGIPSDLTKKADGGPILPEPMQQGPTQLKQVNIKGKGPIITHNPKDPRLKSYNDSLSLYNETNAYRDKIVKSGLYRPKTDVYPVAPKDRPTPKTDRTLTVSDASDPKLYRTNTLKSLMTNTNGIDKVTLHEKKGIAPVNDEFFTRKETDPRATPTGGKGEWYGDSIENYKKPTQPIVYKAPVSKKVSTVAQSPTTDNPQQVLPTLTHDSLMHVQKRDGSIGQWGNDIPVATASVVAPSPTPILSDKARGASTNYYPARGQQQGKDVPVQKSNGSAFGHYKNGGKMADGGNLYPGSVVPYMNVPGFDPTYSSGADLPGVTVSAKALPKAMKPLPVLTGTAVRPLDTSMQPGTTPAIATPNAKPGIGQQISDGFAKISPFLSNFYNATQKLPLPPVPIMNDEVTPNLVDYSASRGEAVRATRSADANARMNLNSGAAVSATKAANLSQQVRSVNQINEAENNTNAGIRNQVASQNAGIKVGNNALQTNYKNELVERTIKGQQLKSANMANIEEKIQGMARDKKLYDNEDTKLMLTALSDDTGASWRGAEPLFKKHLSAESYNQVKDHFDQVTSRQTEDRTAAKTLTAFQIAAAKARTLPDADKSQNFILNGASVATPGKLKRTGTETETNKQGGKTTKRTTSLYN